MDKFITTKKITIEIEDYYGDGKAFYILNLKNDKIEKREIVDEDYNIFKNFKEGCLNDFLVSIKDDFEIVDIDGDYVFNTNNDLVRIQKNKI